MLESFIRSEIASHQGWIGFDRFMSLALYTPGLGYYANASEKFGHLPQGTVQQGQRKGVGSDFVTAPEMSPLFGRTLAQPIAEALAATQTDEIWEFGAGSGALALQVLDALTALGIRPKRYTIVDVSQGLQARQQATLAAYADVVQWASTLPEAMHGVVLGNEVLDAMPVQLLHRVNGIWLERGVAVRDEQFVWQDRVTTLRPPLEIDGAHNYCTEIHAQAEAFVRTLGDRMQRGAAFLIDYGFPEAEYYHPQRHMGTLMCHQLHQSDANPLFDVGRKDITAHVNFTGIAVAAQEAGWEVLGYTSQAHFLLNCGLAEAMQQASLTERIMAQKLIMEHEMGELFKVLAVCKGGPWSAHGFVRGDRTHRL